MPYTETHKLTIGPVLLPEGVDIGVGRTNGGVGPVQVTVEATSEDSKDAAIAMLEQTFAQVMAAAAADGVGTPVFTVAPVPVPAAEPPVSA